MVLGLGAEGLIGAHPVVGGRGCSPGSWSWGQNPSISRAPVLWAHTPPPSEGSTPPRSRPVGDLPAQGLGGA